MINEPSVDSLVENLGTKESPASRYALCVVVAKRARQIVEQQQFLGKFKEISLACNEIASGKLLASND